MSGVFVINENSNSIATITTGPLSSFNRNMIGYPGTIDAVVSVRPVNNHEVWRVVHGYLPEIENFVNKLGDADYFRQHFYSSNQGSIEHLFKIVAPFNLENVSIQLNEVKSRKSLRDTLDSLTDPVASALYFGFDNDDER